MFVGGKNVFKETWPPAGGGGGGNLLESGISSMSAPVPSMCKFLK